MVVTLAGIYMLVKLVQFPNALLPILLKLVALLKSILVSPLQPLKDRSPMLLTPSGIVMLVRLGQFLKALFPMLVTLEGMVMLVRLVQL